MLEQCIQAISHMRPASLGVIPDTRKRPTSAHESCLIHAGGRTITFGPALNVGNEHRRRMNSGSSVRCAPNLSLRPLWPLPLSFYTVEAYQT